MAKLTVLGCFEKRTLFYSFEKWSYLFRKKISTRVYSTSRKLKMFWQKVLYSEVFLVRFTSNLVFAPILSLASSFIFLVGKEIDAVVSCLLFEIILPPENYWKNVFFSILLTDIISFEQLIMTFSWMILHLQMVQPVHFLLHNNSLLFSLLYLDDLWWCLSKLNLKSFFSYHPNGAFKTLFIFIYFHARWLPLLLVFSWFF